jgi:hypothetical protein
VRLIDGELVVDETLVLRHIPAASLRKECCSTS